MFKRFLTLISIGLILIALLLGCLYFAKKPIKSVAWQAPTAPASASSTLNAKLKDTLRIPLPAPFLGAEHIAINADGYAFMGVENGSILRFNTNYPSQEIELWRKIDNGRPMGLEFDQQGNLIVADANLGIYRIAPDKQLTMLTNSYNKRLFGFADDLAVAKNNDVYFSDATKINWRQTNPQLAARAPELEVIEHAGNGALYVYRAASGKTELLLDNLQFANGVELSADEDFVLVAETGSYQVLRYWLKGAKKGKSEIFAANLPGLPDNITKASDGGFWLALILPRNPVLDSFSALPKLRDMLALVPSNLLPKGPSVAHVLKLDKNGKIIKHLQAVNPPVHSVTTALEHNNKLFLGSLSDTAIGVYMLDGETTYSKDNK